MRFVPLIALISMGAATNPGDGVPPPANPSVQPTVLPSDQPDTLEACLDQALLLNDALADWRYMAVCAMRFPKVERDAFEAYIQPNDPATPVRVGNIVLTGLGMADFLEEEAARHAQMPEALKPVLGYWRVDEADFKTRKDGGNFIEKMANEAFSCFPHVSTVVNRVDGFFFSRKYKGDYTIVEPIDARSPIAWAAAFYATARHYGIRGQIVVDDATLEILTQGLRRPQVLASKQGPERTTPFSKQSFWTTWHLVQLP